MPAEHNIFRLALLWLIVSTSVAFQIPSIVATIMGTHGSLQTAIAISERAIYLGIGYAGHDVILSGLFMYYFWRYMHASAQELPGDIKMRLRRTWWLILGLTVLILSGVIISLVLMGERLFLARYAVVPVINALTLKFEFFALNRVLEVARLRNEALQRGNLSRDFGSIGERPVQEESTDSAIMSQFSECPQLRSLATEDRAGSSKLWTLA